MKRQAAFSLAELLVVVTIIGLLVAILVPTLGRAKEHAKRGVCTSNLRAIGGAAQTYCGEYGVFPALQNAWTEAAYVGYRGGDTDATLGNDNGKSHSRAWYRLVAKSYVGLGAFKCPSDVKVDPGNSQGGAYDFPAGNENLAPLSYSLQVALFDPAKPKTSPVRGCLLNLTTNAEVAIAADNNGLLKWTRISADNYWRGERDTSVTWPPADAGQLNSPNHNREGQNVLYILGTVSWRRTPLAGANNDNIIDNIFTRYDGSPLGANDDTGITGVRPMDGYNDSLLLP